MPLLKKRWEELKKEMPRRMETERFFGVGVRSSSWPKTTNKKVERKLWSLEIARLSVEREAEMLHVFGAGSGAAWYAMGRAWGRVLHACTYDGVNRCRFFLVAGVVGAAEGTRAHVPWGRRGGGGHRKR